MCLHGSKEWRRQARWRVVGTTYEGPACHGPNVGSPQRDSHCHDDEDNGCGQGSSWSQGDRRKYLWILFHVEHTNVEVSPRMLDTHMLSIVLFFTLSQGSSSCAPNGYTGRSG